MARDRSKDIEILDMPLPVAMVAFLSAVALLFLAGKFLISYRVVFPMMQMEPYIHLFDVVIVDRHAYASGDGPERGDVVAVEVYPGILVPYRVLGRPGDLLRRVKGRFELNGKLVPRSCASVTLPPEPALESFRRSVGPEFTVKDLEGMGLPANLAPDLLCEESWPGVKRAVRTFDWSAGRPDFDDRQQLIAQQQYFLIGDNRTRMSDSLLAFMEPARDDTARNLVHNRRIYGRVIGVAPTTKFVVCPMLAEQSVERPAHPSCSLLLAEAAAKSVTPATPRTRPPAP